MCVSRTAVVVLICSICCALLAASQAMAEALESFYSGRTVTMLVGTSPGGINDISARLVARHLSRFIAGNPTIIVQNNPGSGGLVTANRLYFNSEKDGSVLAMQRGELDGQMVGLSSVRTGQRDLWVKRAFRPLMAFGRARRHPEFPEMPIARELTDDGSALALIEFAELPFFMALPFAAPPDIPPDRAKVLQTAFAAMCRDRGFVE